MYFAAQSKFQPWPGSVIASTPAVSSVWSSKLCSVSRAFSKPNLAAEPLTTAKSLGKISISEVFIDAKVEAGPGQVKLQEGAEGVGGAQEQAEAREGRQVLPMI